ncbi:MAG: NAD-dependent epimerase/dehydratase family protein [Burkholderiaceae bacterium]
MRVLITGGAGFIGQRLIADLLARGIALAPAPVRAVERVLCLDQAPGELRDPRLDYVAADIAQDTVFERLFKTPFDLVLHLAAVVSGTAEADFELGMRVNLDGTRRLLDACRVAGDRPRLLFSSSVAVFGGELPGGGR